ncbi:hypothetical protein [Mesorhizobium sp. M1409]
MNESAAPIIKTIVIAAAPASVWHANLYWGPTLQILKAVCERA